MNNKKMMLFALLSLHVRQQEQMISYGFLFSPTTTTTSFVQNSSLHNTLFLVPTTTLTRRRQQQTAPLQLFHNDNNDYFYYYFGTVAENAWSNPASERLKSMVGTTLLWAVPLAVLIVVALIAAVFSAVMPIVDNMFYGTLREEARAYLPGLWEDYQNDPRLRQDESFDTRLDLQLELWDELARYKAQTLREICLLDDDDDNVDDNNNNDDDFYKSLWHRVNAELEEGEELENRPDLIAFLEVGILKKQTMLSNNNNNKEVTRTMDEIVTNELNRMDLVMRFFNKSTEFAGNSRRTMIYQQWEEKKKKKKGKKEQATAETKEDP
jgi:hypothetical protein